MKNLKLITLFCLCITFAQAQTDYKHSLNGVKKVQVYSDSDITIANGTSKELLIKNLETDEEEVEKAKGLKAIYSNGTDNTNGHGLSITKEGDILIIKDLKSHFNRDNLTFIIPKTIDLIINSGNLGDISITNFSSEIELQSNVGDIQLNNVTGPITANTATGDINVIFTSVSQSSPISLRSSTGDVDISIPSSTKANLELKSTMGTIYTDFDIAIPKNDDNDDMNVIGATRKVETALNNGGVIINLSSSTGNVYLRKK